MNAATKIKLKALFAVLEEGSSTVTTALTDAQDHLDAQSESWQEGDKGQALSETIDSLSAIESGIQEALDSLANINLE